VCLNLRVGPFLKSKWKYQLPVEGFCVCSIPPLRAGQADPVRKRLQKKASGVHSCLCLVCLLMLCASRLWGPEPILSSSSVSGRVAVPIFFVPYPLPIIAVGPGDWGTLSRTTVVSYTETAATARNTRVSWGGVSASFFTYIWFAFSFVDSVSADGVAATRIPHAGARIPFFFFFSMDLYLYLCISSPIAPVGSSGR